MLSEAICTDNPCAACAIREQTVCAALTQRGLGRLSAIVTRVGFAPGQAVFFEGQAVEHVFNVVEGIVRLTRLLPNGRRQVTGFVHPGNFLGIACRDTYGHTAEAVTRLTLCRFVRSRLQAFLQEHPEMERRVLAMASGELWVAQSQMLLLGRKTARERLATFLLSWAEAWGRAPQGPWADSSERVIALPMPRIDIADHLGLTRETVSRVLTALVMDGTIDIPEPALIVLRRPDRLAKFAEGDG